MAEEKARTRNSRRAGEPEPLDAETEGLIAGHLFRRDEQQYDWRTEKKALAHTAREIAEHLTAIAGILEHHPLRDHEKNSYRETIDGIGRLTPNRRKLAPAKVKQAGEPFTMQELHQGWASPLGSAWVQWSQVFNRSEFAEDREAMLAITRTLKALSLAFWPKDEDSGRRDTVPANRSARAANVLAELGARSRAFLGDEEDVVTQRPEIVDGLLRRLADSMREPFFVWQASDPALLFRKREPSDRELGDVANAQASSLLDSLEHGFGLTEMKADLPGDFLSRRDQLVAVFTEHLREHFDPGHDVDDLERPMEGARVALKAALRCLGYPEPKNHGLFRYLAYREKKARGDIADD